MSELEPQAALKVAFDGGRADSLLASQTAAIDAAQMQIEFPSETLRRFLSIAALRGRTIPSTADFRRGWRPC